MLLPIVMPKWGLAMQEGLLARWSVAEGDKVVRGQDLADIETTKIANTFESPVEGTVCRLVARSGETLPVGGLLAVVAEETADIADVDRFVAAFEVPASADTSAETAPRSDFIETRAGRLRYLRLGPETGIPIVLVHGFGADLTGWLFNHADLATTRPVYALDLPGHGESTKHVPDGSVAGLSAAVLGFLDALDLQRVHLVGHSLGGAIAAQIAVDHPERVEAATLIAPAGLGPEISQAFIEGFITETRLRKLRGVLEMLVADPGLITGEMVELALRYKRLDGVNEALRTIAGANFSEGRQTVSLRETIENAGVPVRVIVGSEDKVIPATQVDGLAGGVVVMRIAGAGHLPHMEKSADVNAAILG